MLSPTRSDDPATTVFTSDRRFKLWRYGVGHSQMLLRSMPSDGWRCLDVNFERVVWLSLPTAMDAIEIALVAGGDLDLPTGVSRLLDERSPLLLKISSQGISGLVICAGVEAAYTAWSPTTTDIDSRDDEVIWTLRKG
jgi:hypothetical protein